MNHEVINRFFQKNCTEEEAKAVADYLKDNPSILKEYLSLHEWNTVVADNTVPPEFWDEIWNNIQKQNKAKLIALQLKRIAAAAFIIVLVGATYFYLKTNKEDSIPIARADINVLPPRAERKEVSNNTGKMMTVLLEDSSLIKLSPASFVQYDVPFPKDKREIMLEGEAEFHVTKNRQKPFSVYTGALATTALGTVFSIKRNNDKKTITVKLLEGKVIIHPSINNLKNRDKDIYLSPGEQLNFNETSSLLVVEKINKKKSDAINVDKTVPDSINDKLVFSNTLLPEVMHKLSAYYKVKISYDTALIDTINFSGTITRKDSLPVILKAICTMNDLDLLDTGNEYRIYKTDN